MAKYQIVGATGCAAGIAHTYMAQEAIVEAAKARGLSAKIEAHGRMGTENELTPQEIAEADAVILAADKEVGAERFKGKRVISVPVAQAIKDPDGLIDRALKAEVAKSPADDEQDTSNGESVQDFLAMPKGGSGFGFTLYKALMNGVSHMLPFVVGGGILIALSMLWGINSADPSSAQYNETAALLKSVGLVGFGLMVPVMAGYIAESIFEPALVGGFVGGMIANTAGAGFLGGIVAGFLAGYVFLLLSRAFKGIPKSLSGIKAIILLPLLGMGITGVIMSLIGAPMASISDAMVNFLGGFTDTNPLLLGIIVGCMSAFDMGGPVNKAASLVSLALIDKGNLFFCAGFSAACIAPPLICGIATVVFKKYYTPGERSAGLVNFILGSTHITEGAIPFAVEDPIRNLPILMLGSSIAAAMTYFFQCQVPVPAGAFLLLPLVVNPVQWVLSILTGSVVAGLLMGYVRMRRVQKGHKKLA